MFTLYYKEISSFLNSLIGYVVITVFLLINALFLWVFQFDFNILDGGYAILTVFYYSSLRFPFFNTCRYYAFFC